MQSWVGMLFLLMAFGPLAIMGGLWAVALVLWLAGRPRFLTMLVERTGLGQRGDRTADGEQGEGTQTEDDLGPCGEPPAGATKGEP